MTEKLQKGTHKSGLECVCEASKQGWLSSSRGAPLLEYELGDVAHEELSPSIGESRLSVSKRYSSSPCQSPRGPVSSSARAEVLEVSSDSAMAVKRGERTRMVSSCDCMRRLMVSSWSCWMICSRHEPRVSNCDVSSGERRATSKATLKDSSLAARAFSSELM